MTKHRCRKGVPDIDHVKVITLFSQTGICIIINCASIRVHIPGLKQHALENGNFFIVTLAGPLFLFSKHRDQKRQANQANDQALE